MAVADSDFLSPTLSPMRGEGTGGFYLGVCLSPAPNSVSPPPLSGSISKALCPSRQDGAFQRIHRPGALGGLIGHRAHT